MMSATTSAPTWHAVKHCVCASARLSHCQQIRLSGGAPKGCWKPALCLR